MKAEGCVNGAETLVRTLVSSGVDTCFANPGTSESSVGVAQTLAALIRKMP
jgi:thiamine pyrophosphate-dependent acetolactate synthase large subunit-like protein